MNSAAGSTLGLERILAIPLKAKMVLQKAQVVHVATVGTALRVRFRVDLPVIKRLEKTVRKEVVALQSYEILKIAQIVIFHYFLPGATFFFAKS